MLKTKKNNGFHLLKGMETIPCGPGTMLSTLSTFLEFSQHLFAVDIIILSFQRRLREVKQLFYVA